MRGSPAVPSPFHSAGVNRVPGHITMAILQQWGVGVVGEECYQRISQMQNLRGGQHYTHNLRGTKRSVDEGHGLGRVGDVVIPRKRVI